MQYTGTLWRVLSLQHLKERYTAFNVNAGLEVTSRPMRRKYLLASDVAVNHIVGMAQVGEVVLVGSEPHKDCGGDPFVEYVQVISPYVGYMNTTYFTKDSIWLERIA